MEQLLQDPRLLWAIGVTLFGVVATAFWKYAKWWFNHSHQHTRIDESFEEVKADIGSLKDEVKADITSFKDEVKADVDSFKADIASFKEEVKADIRELRADIKAILGRESTVADSDSPLHLNELGKKVSLSVNAKEIAAQEAPKVRELLPSHNPYDIQTFCKEHFERGGAFKPTADQLDAFKQCAFDQGIGLDQVGEVCAYELRDELRRLIAAGPHVDGSEKE